MSQPAAPGAPSNAPAPPAEPAGPANTPPNPPAPAPAPVASPPGDAQSVDQLPAFAQKIITDARTEAAGYRTQLRDAQAASQQQGELTRKVAEALGIHTNGQPDPAKLTEQVTAAQAAARQSTVELAVWKAAATAGGNAEALLDSRTFVDTITKLDPASSSFAKDVSDAIAAAVASSDRFKAAASGQAPATPPARFPAGADGGARGGTTVSQLTEADLARMSPEQIVDAQEKGQLNDLLGIKS